MPTEEEKLAIIVGSTWPTGAIIAWYGKDGSSLPNPNVWAVCDGTNGTPDLRGKFVQGTAALADIGLDLGARATHSHSAVAMASGSPVVYSTTQGNDDLATLFSNHQHSVNVSDASNIPPNWRLIYIMKR